MESWNKQYDYKRLNGILDGEGTWLNAHTLRYLHIAMAKADHNHLSNLLSAFPEQCVALYFHYDWKAKDILDFVKPFVGITTFSIITELVETYEA